MSVLSSIIRSVRERIHRRTFSEAMAFMEQQTSSGYAGAQITDALQQSVWVYGCIQAIADAVAQLEFKIGYEDDREVNERHQAYVRAMQVFHEPAPGMSNFDFWELLIDWLMLRGRCFVCATTADNQVVRVVNRLRGDPLPERLWILPADKMRPIKTGRTVTGWAYQPGTDDPLDTLVFRVDELVVLRLPNPYSSIEGLPPLFVATTAAETDYAAARFMRGLMFNNADSGLIVSTDQWLGDEQRAQVQAALRERKRLAGTADRPLILGGGLRVEKPAISTADIQFLANRQYSRQEICAVYRVPESLLGFTADANRSVGMEQRANFIEHRIGPLCVRIDASLDTVVRCFDPLFTGWHDLDGHPAMVHVRRNRVDTMIKLFGIGYPLNTINDWLDMGLPDVPWGEQGFLPFSVQPAAQAGEPVELKPMPPELATPPATEPSPTEPAQPVEGNVWQQMLAAVNAPDHVCMSSEEWVSSITGSFKKKRGIMRRFLFEQRARVLRNLARAVPSQTDAAPDTATRAGTWGALMDIAQETALLAARIKPALLADLAFGGAQVWQELGQPGDYAVKPTEAIRFLSNREKRIKDMNQSTFDSLIEELQEGLDEGEGLNDLAERVRKVFRKASDVRAETIAQTETVIAINTGRYEAMKETGCELKSWLASRLANVRPAHAQAARDYQHGIPLDQDFIVGGERLRYPGDPNGSAANVINCRCSVLAHPAGKSGAPVAHLRFEDWLARQTIAQPAVNVPGSAAEAGGVEDTTQTVPVKMQEPSAVLQDIPVQGDTIPTPKYPT